MWRVANGLDKAALWSSLVFLYARHILWSLSFAYNEVHLYIRFLRAYFGWPFSPMAQIFKYRNIFFIFLLQYCVWKYRAREALRMTFFHLFFFVFIALLQCFWSLSARSNLDKKFWLGVQLVKKIIKFTFYSCTWKTWNPI